MLSTLYSLNTFSPFLLINSNSAVLCLVAQLCPTLCNPMEWPCQTPLSMGTLQARILEWAAMPSSRGSSHPGIEPRSPTSQTDSLPFEPPGKPKNTGVDSLSLLQGIFPTQELNWALLRCRQILHHLSYQGSPCFSVTYYKEKPL